MKSILSFSLLIVVSCTLVGGCSKKVDTTAGPPTGEKPTISQAEADKRVQGIQNNKDIPDNAKAGIIAEIQASVKK